MTQLYDIVNVNSDFKNAINLYLDLNNIEKVSSYIPTKSSVDILDQYLHSVEENRQQATLLVGPYGKGKSHLLLLLIAVLSLKRDTKNKMVIGELCKKVSGTDYNVSRRINTLFEKTPPFLPVIIMSTNGDLHQAFMVGLFEALKREGLTNLTPATYFSYALETINRWRDKFPDTYHAYRCELKKRKISLKEMIAGLRYCENDKLEIFKEIYPLLTSGEIFNPLINAEVLPMYKNIADKLREEYGYSGIYIIFDEFSKFIEGQNKTASGNNMKLLQDICELANDSKESQIFLTMVAHKSIKEYGKYLSIDTINSFTGIEGRIKEIFFVTSSKNNYELIKNAIHKNEKIMDSEKRILNQLKKGEDSYQKLISFSSVFNKSDFRNIVVRGCYPLSPVSAYLLLNISEKVAQNERTLFTFISKDEQYSMIHYIKEMSPDMPWIINADLIYDYFKGLFKKDISNEFVHNEWLNAEYALTQVSDYKLEKLIKVLAIINIVNKPDELPANMDHIQLACGLPESVAGMEELLQKKLVYKRKSTGCYTFKTRATSKIRTEIRKRKELKENRVSIGQILSEVAETKYVLPRKYNKEYTMTRYFNYEYMNVEDFLNIQDLRILFDDGNFCDGKVLALYSFVKEDQTEHIAKRLNKSCPENLIVVYRQRIFDILDQVCEYDAVRELENDRLFFDIEENKVLERELPAIEEDLEKDISFYLEDTFGDKTGKTIFYCRKGISIIDTESKLADIVDQICMDMYNCSISVNNELINREEIRTAPIKKVRKNLIEILLTHGDTKRFMSGTSADATIYRALFVGTGICSGRYKKNVKKVLDVFNTFIDRAADRKLSMSDLIGKLASDPYGMRRGVIPIYFSYILSIRNEEIIVYFGDREVEITPDIVLNMCEKPNDYCIYVSMDDIKKEKYIQDLCDLFHIVETAQYTNSKLSSIVTGMQRWFRSLPQITKNIRNQEEYFCDMDVGNALPELKMLLQAVDTNPFEILFEKLPDILDAVNDFDLVINKLSNIKIKLSGFYEWIRERTIKAVINCFDEKNCLDLKHTLDEWYNRQSNMAKHGLQSQKITNFMLCITENESYDDGEIVEKIVKAVTGIYMDSWNDASFGLFMEQLASVKKEVESINDENVNDRKCELSFIGRSGRLITKYYEPVSEETGAILRNILSDNLEDFSDLSVNDKIAILLEMIEKELS